MIRSRFSRFKYIGQVVLTIMLLFLVFLFVISFLRKQYPVAIFSIEGIVWILLTIVLPVVIFYQMILNYRTVIIDNANKTVSFKAFITGTITTYDFEYFDGYADTIKLTNMGKVKTLYLIKDDIVQYKIAANFYENFDELQDGFKQLKYLGFVKYTFPLSLKIAFGNPIF